MQKWPFSRCAITARRLEASETPSCSARGVLRSEILTPNVWDPACGRGICAEAAREAGYNVFASDIYDWGYGDSRKCDFLKCKAAPAQFAERLCPAHDISVTRRHLHSRVKH